MASKVMSEWDVFWSPTGQKIATVQASTAKAAKRKAPVQYRRYKGEMYVVKKNPSTFKPKLGKWIPVHAVKFLKGGITQLMK